MLGQYQILSEIGRGGMGIVYKAWQPMLKRYVAIKILPPHFAQDTEFVRRFHQEAQNAAGLNHPNIVHIYDFGIQQGYQFIVMELLEGETLASLIARHGALSVDYTAGILAQIASALDYAHSRKIIHRDLKPANIMVTPDSRAILTDFGIAKALEGTQIARSSHLIGTPAYMSPEQIQSQFVTPQSDIYSLGIVVYEMLTGRVPFQGNTATVLHAHVYQPPPPLRSLNPQVPPEVENAVIRALAKNSQERYPTANEFAQAVRGKVKSRDDKSLLSEARAGSMRRLFGLIIDLTLLFIFFALFMGVAAGVPSSNAIASVTFFFFLLGLYGYFVFMWMLSGQTIGQMVVGIRVLSNTGDFPSWWQSTKRWFVQMLTVAFGSSIIFYILLVYLWHRYGKPPHDEAAGTEAVRTRFVAKSYQQYHRPVSAGRLAGTLLAGTAFFTVPTLLMAIASLFIRTPMNNPSVTNRTFPTVPVQTAVAGIPSPALPSLPTPTPIRIIIPTSTPVALIDRPANEINLQLRDLGGTFSLSEEMGKDTFADSTTRDGNYRLFESKDGVFIESTIGIGHFRAADTMPDLMKIVENELQTTLKTQTISFGTMTSVSFGERGGVESFSIEALGASGYILIFIKQNVVVLLIEFGPTHKVRLDDVFAHARIIESRIR